ncbi:uncharacterized protein YqeY [Mycobacterium sp. MAA66]
MTNPGHTTTVVGMTQPAVRWRTTLRDQLLIARKARATVRTAALRSALSAIDNAETPDIIVPKAGAIADSASGLGAAEVTRRSLTDVEIRALIQTEIDERHSAAMTLLAAGHHDRVEQLGAEAAALADLLNVVGPA